jgi:hypothetical protein
MSRPGQPTFEKNVKAIPGRLDAFVVGDLFFIFTGLNNLQTLRIKLTDFNIIGFVKFGLKYFTLWGQIFILDFAPLVSMLTELLFWGFPNCQE